MQIEGRVGGALGADGVQEPIRLGRSLDQIVSDLHADYAEAAFRGSIFSAYLQNASAVAAGQQDNAAAAASTNFVLANPKGSAVSLSLLKFFLAWKSGTPVAGPLMHAIVDVSAVATSVFSTAPTKHRPNGPASAAGALASAAGAALTGGLAPALLRPSALYMTATAPAAVSLIPGYELLDGDIILPPGWAWAPLFPNGTWTSPSYTLGVEWEELPYTP